MTRVQRLPRFKVRTFFRVRTSIDFSDVLFGFLNRIRQLVGLFGLVVSSSQRPLPTQDNTTYAVHRSRVDPRKECESCGNARFREKK
jgi:hypothetical protein